MNGFCLVQHDMILIPARWTDKRDGCPDWCTAKADAAQQRVNDHERLWQLDFGGKAKGQLSSGPNAHQARAVTDRKVCGSMKRLSWGSVGMRNSLSGFKFDFLTPQVGLESAGQRKLNDLQRSRWHRTQSLRCNVVATARELARSFMACVGLESQRMRLRP